MSSTCPTPGTCKHMRRVHLKASGSVQGVFFRATTRDEARRLGLTGWVRNAPDGTVECEAQGDDTAVDSLVEFCSSGPGHARVTDLQVTNIEPVAGEDSFDVR